MGWDPGAGCEELSKGVEPVVAVFAGGVEVAAGGGVGLGVGEAAKAA